MIIAQLIYASQPFGFDDAMLNGILVQARRNNPRDDITGCLICRQDLYVQFIEGPVEAIDALYTKILVDDRHLNVELLSRSFVAKRMFAEWAMRDDPARSWLWSQDAIANGALARATAEDMRTVFAQIGQ